VRKREVAAVAKDTDSAYREVRSDTERHSEAMVESYKMEFEIHKTQATLVTGSLVAVIALSDLLVPDHPRYVLILAASCVLLLVSMDWALAGMLRLTTMVMVTLSPYSSEELRNQQERGIKSGRRLSLVSFPVGVGLFAVYVFFNQFF